MIEIEWPKSEIKLGKRIQIQLNQSGIDLMNSEFKNWQQPITHNNHPANQTNQIINSQFHSANELIKLKTFSLLIN